MRLVLDEGKSVGAVARDLDLTETALREWVKQRAGGSHEGPHGPDDGRARGAGAAPQRESGSLQEERDILKKATAFFAKQSR